MSDSTRTQKLSQLLVEPVKNGYSPVCVNEKTSKIILSLGALTGTGLDLNEVKWVPETNQQVDKYQIRPNDFLVSRSNTLDKVGRAALYKGGLNNCSYPDLMMKFRVNENLINPFYLELYLQSYPARKHFMRRASGTSSSMVKITKSAVETLEVPVLDLYEQDRVVKCIQKWTQAIEKTEAIIAAKQKQFEWLVEKLISKNQESIDWKSISLSELFNIHTYSSKSKQVCDEGQNIIVDMGSITRKGELIGHKLTNISHDALLLGDLVMPKDDIGGGNIIGKVAIIEEANKYVCGDHVYRLTQKKHNDPHFLKFLINSPIINRQLRAKANGTSQLGLSKKDVIKQLVKLPPLGVQNTISKILMRAQSEIKLFEQITLLYKTQKRGLMQKLLTGEWRIKTKEVA